MAEKRKLPPRAGREPAAKRRVSEAATPAPKKKALTPRVPTPPPEPVEAPLPSKMRDGEPLPVVRVRQPATLSDQEYQSIAESAVLLASLERSKKKWLSDGILVRYYTKPKKTKREQIEKNNPPKDSMARIGTCDITVGPHLFGAMLYIVKDPTVPPPIQYATPQRPMVHYGHPNNFQQYQPYPSPSSGQRRPPYPPVPPGRPPQGYPGNAPNNAPRGTHQAHHAPSPAGQRQGQNAAPGQPAKQNPDPVIQMLATRAAADPELKALMRVVASSQATQEQLRAFQAHIDELNAIIKSREQQEQRQQSSSATSTQPKPTPQPATPVPQTKTTPPQPETQQKKAPEQQEPSKDEGNKQEPKTQTATPSKEPPKQPASSEPQTSESAKSQPEEKPQSGQLQTPAQPQEKQSSGVTQTSSGQPAVKQEPATAGPNNPQGTPASSSQPATSTQTAKTAPAGTPVPNGVSQQQSPAMHPSQPPSNAQQPAPRPGPPYPPYQQASNGVQPSIQSRPPQYNTPGSYYRPPAPPTRPAPLGYKAVVFEFTSPLTPYGSSTSGHAGSGDRYLFPEYSILEWLPNECTILASFLVVRKVDPSVPFPIEPAQDSGNGRGKGKGASKSKKGKAEKGKDGNKTPAPNQAGPATSTETPMKPEPSDKPEANTAPQGTPSTPAELPANETKLKEYWQPVTFRIHAPQAKTLEPLTRVVKPADEVRKYMNEIMDRAERAPDGFPAFRLPREEAREVFEAEGTPASATTSAAPARARPSRATGKVAEEESEAENNLPDFEEEEEELKDFYGEPMGLPPLRA